MLILHVTGVDISICLAISARRLNAFSAEESPSPVNAIDRLKQVVVKQLAAYGHLHLIEGILEDKVAVEVVYPA